jgi:cold shock CspA family protein
MDIFFHRTGISNSVNGIPQDGQEVEYEVGEDRKGPCAVHVKPC